MFYRLRKNKKAFTLVELIVVIAIIAVLATAAGLAVSGILANSRKTTFLSNAKTIADQINLFEGSAVPDGTAVTDDTLDDYLGRVLEAPVYNLIDSNDAADFTRNTMKDLVSEEIRIYDESNGFEVYVKFQAGKAYVDEDTFSDEA